MDPYFVSEGRLTVVELFAGAGGLAIGLERAGLEAVALYELDKHAAATLRQNRPDWNVVEGDVSEADYTGIKADVVTGGFPCQAFSYAGKKLGFEDTRGTLFFEFARAVKEIQPQLFLAENVAGLVSHEKGRTLQIMLTVLRDMGYDVQWKILNAVEHNVPQKRRRIVIIGTLPGIHFEYPEPSDEWLTLSDALKDVPESPGQSYSEKRRKILELVPPGGSWVDLPLELQKVHLGKSFYSGGGKRGMARRISWNEPCLTLTTSPAQKQTERCHPDETRPFTTREYARIQTFPDEWQFSGGLGAVYKQIGNAVPVNLAQDLGRQVIKALTEGDGGSEMFDERKFDQQVREKILRPLIETKDDDDIYRNTIDPFSAAVDSALRGITGRHWLNSERARQRQKSLQNKIGDLHEIALDCISSCRRRPKPHPDVDNLTDKWLAEVKNKYNTTKGSDRPNRYDDLVKHLDSDEYNGFTAYFVEIMQRNKQTFDKPFCPSGRIERKDIRHVDGRTFYAMASGDPDFIDKLFTVHLERALDAGIRDLGENLGFVMDEDLLDLFRRAF